MILFAGQVKWVPNDHPSVGDPLAHVVILAKLQGVVLQVAYNRSGHTVVRKTYDCLVRSFYWEKGHGGYIQTCQLNE